MTDTQDKFNWDLVDGSSFPESRTKKALSKVMRQARREKPARRRGSFMAWLTAAAAVLVILPAVTLLIHRMMTGNRTEVVQLTASAANGQTRTIYLPDSTKVVLNSGSVLFYPSGFSGKERRVCLSGEAVFDVTADSKRPFLVSTADITVKVFGTLFDVQAYPEDPTVSASLCRGAVGIFRNSDPAAPAMLRPGEEFRMVKEDGSFRISSVEPEDVTVWERGGVCLNAGDIHDLIRLLERRFDVNIYLTTDRYDSEIITAKFIHGESIDEILTVISRLLPGMTYNITNNTNIYIH